MLFSLLKHYLQLYITDNNLKNILVRTFKFGMWVHMGNATNAIVL